MKKNILILLLLISSGVFAQGKKHERITAYKTAYITEKLELTSKEAEVFWPIYNRYDQEQRNIRRSEHNDIHCVLNDDVSNISEVEAEKLLKRMMQLEEERLRFRKEMTVALREVLSPAKIVLLQKVEHDFKRELLNRYRSGRGKGENTEK